MDRRMVTYQRGELLTLQWCSENIRKKLKKEKNICQNAWRVMLPSTMDTIMIANPSNDSLSKMFTVATV